MPQQEDGTDGSDGESCGLAPVQVAPVDPSSRAIELGEAQPVLQAPKHRQLQRHISAASSYFETLSDDLSDEGAPDAEIPQMDAADDSAHLAEEPLQSQKDEVSSSAMVYCM